MGKLFAIAGNTFIEAVRQPIYGVLLWAAAFWIAAFGPSLSAFSLESGGDTKILKDVALSTLLLFGLLASVFTAAGVITREIESFTVLTVVSKPVSRPVFLIGKYLGVAGAMAVAFWFLAIVLLMTVRHGVLETVSDKYDQPVLIFGFTALGISLIAAAFGNFVYGWNFSTAILAWVIPLGTAALIAALFFDRTWKPQSPLKDFGDLQVIYAIILIFLAVLILAAFAVAFSTRFSQVMTLMLCAFVFVLGLLSDYYFGTHAGKALPFALLYAAVPNFQFFWVGNALTQGMVIPAEQVLRVAAYTGLYTMAILGLGVAMFQTREVG